MLPGGLDQCVGQFTGTPLIAFKAAKESVAGIDDDSPQIMGNRPPHLSHMKIELR